jgi:hypothetical protein
MVFIATFNNINIYIVAVSVIGGGNRSARRKPPTCRKSPNNRMSMSLTVYFVWHPLRCVINVIKFVNDLRQVGGYDINIDIVESGDKHHNPNTN